MTEQLRPPPVRRTTWWFALRNAAWSALLGALITIGWMTIYQSFTYAVLGVVIGAALSAIYGLLASIPAVLAGRAAHRFQSVVVAVVFASTAMAIQIAVSMLAGVFLVFAWHAVLYSVIGGALAGLVFRTANPCRARPVDTEQQISAP